MPMLELEEVWKKEKALLEGASKSKELLEQAKIELEAARRADDLQKCPSCNTAAFLSWKNNWPPPAKPKAQAARVHFAA